MAGRVSFNIELVTIGEDDLENMQARTRDLSAVFDVIIDKWSEGNVLKFAQAIGKEGSGVDLDPGVFWEGLTGAYVKQKRRLGQANQIMVATGSLRNALTSPDGFFREVTPAQAGFGTPVDPDDAKKAAYNWIKRQTVFLSVDDQRMIEKEISDFLSLGGDWQKELFGRGMEAVNRRVENARLDVEFESAMASSEA